MIDGVRRVGHKGADLIEPGNTRVSFDAALAHGVDMIELDVLPERVPGDRPGSAVGRLILAHDYEDAAARVPLTLEEGLAHLASEPFAGIDFIIDLKLPGYEDVVVDAIGKPASRTVRFSRRSFRTASCDCARWIRMRGSHGRCRARGATTRARSSWRDRRSQPSA